MCWRRFIHERTVRNTLWGQKMNDTRTKSYEEIQINNKRTTAYGNQEMITELTIMYGKGEIEG